MTTSCLWNSIKLASFVKGIYVTESKETDCLTSVGFEHIDLGVVFVVFRELTVSLMRHFEGMMLQNLEK